MSTSRTRAQKAAVAAMALGGVAIASALLAMLLGGSSTDDDRATAPPSTTAPFEVFDAPPAGEPAVTDVPTSTPTPSQDNPLALLGKGAGDPFATTSGDTSKHRVTVTFTSDGSLYAGYRFRNGGDGIQVADKTLTITRTVRGPLPVALAGVQALGNATYATCEIQVDGVTTIKQTAKGTNYVTVCTS